ncbi:hypothetical protein Tco_1388783, partial [Tanacetum coccineum]
LGRLRHDIMSCEYEDVHILWGLLEKSDTRLSQDFGSKKRGPFSRMVEITKFKRISTIQGDIVCACKTHWVRAIKIPGWTLNLDDQNDEESDSEDEECEEVFKKDFGESDEEVQGENDVSRVSNTNVKEENPKSKDGVVSSEQNGKQSEDPENDVENVEMDNQKDNYDGEFGNVNNIPDEVNFSSGFNTYKKAGRESMDSDHCIESEGSRKGSSILMLMDELVKVG